MLIPNPSQAEDSLSPPPYTPTSSSSVDPSQVPLEATLRGGDAHPFLSVNDHHFPSAASYLAERPCTAQYSSSILHHTLVFSPNATRDDFPFPQPETQYWSRDVSVHDWDTFLNYLLPPDLGPEDGKGRLSRPRSKDALRDQDRIEAVLAEWHQSFFGPRGIQIEANLPTSSYVNATPPPPFTSTADIGYYPEANSSTSRDAPLPSRASRPPMPPQPSMPPQPPMTYGQSPLQWARNSIIGPRLGSIPLARLLSNNRDQQPGMHENYRSRRERHSHEKRERRGRSPSSSSSSSSGSSAGRHHRRRGGRHGHPGSSTSSSSSSPSSNSGHGGWGHHHHHRGGHNGGWGGGRGRHHHHPHGHDKHRRRRRSSSSSSSSSSDSSVASISSSDFFGADPQQIRHSIAALRQNPDRKAHLSATIRQFKNDIRQSRRQNHDNTRGIRTSLKRENSRELKAQGKELKAELKGFIKEARALRKADRKVRKAERKSLRAERRAERRGMDAHGKSQRKVAKAEAKALKAQRRAVEAHEMARASRAVEAKGKARTQEDGMLYDGERYDAHTWGNEFEAADRARDCELAERTRSLGLSDTKGQETGIVAKEG
ncbi:MAG: hypothetical protein Q9181_000288 [Wetmoreana brouardii]